MPVPQQNGDGANDDQALDVLDEVVLKRFVVEPQKLAPFDVGTLHWEVTVPRNPPVAVTIQLDGAAVPATGALPVAPPTTSTYRLTARAGRSSKLLGQVTVVVELGACTTMVDNQVVKWVAGAIATKIQERTDGVYLRTVAFHGVEIPNPQVWITTDRMHLRLVLGKNVKRFPDPTITIDASFELAVVPGTAPPGVHHPVLVDKPGIEFPPKLAPIAKEISTDVSFPATAWLVPGAIIFLPIAISQGEGDAHRTADSMIDQIVDGILNGFFTGPPNTYKHNVRLFTDTFGGEFSVTFCPIPGPVVKDTPASRRRQTTAQARQTA
jgi:hypothetical protein